MKNEPAKDCYSTHKFHVLAEEGSGTLWSVDLKDAEIACPEWIRLTVSEGGLV
jgi:hypothetical protein